MNFNFDDKKKFFGMRWFKMMGIYKNGFLYYLDI